MNFFWNFFPLFRLPSLALIELFKGLDPIELFILSQCSRKVANCVHIAGTKKWKLSVEVGNKVININDSYRIDVIESSRKPLWKYDRLYKTLSFEYRPSKDSKLELRKVLSQVQTAFRCPVTSFEYRGWSDTDQCWFSVLKHITQNQIQPLESLDLCGSFKNEDLEWIFQNLKITRKVNIHSLGDNSVSSGFRPACEGLELMIIDSCKYIELALSSFTIHALDVFMKKWKTGSYPNLQYMLIKRCELNWVDSILGFKRDEMKQLGVRRRLVTDEVWAQCTGGVDIKADNGMNATMQLGRRSSDWFELFVWNK